MSTDSDQENVCHHYRDIARALRKPVITSAARRLRFGRSIAEARKDLRLTQGQLGRELGVGQNTVSKWECGKVAIRKQHREAVVDYLGIEEPEGGPR